MNEAQIIDLLLRYFNAYGYFIVFFLLLLENIFLIGMFVPGEVVLLVGSFAAAQGELRIGYVIILGIVAATIGNIAGYLIGMRGGRPLLEKYGGRFVSPEKISAAEQYFDKHGSKTVFIGRFVTGAKAFVALLAGAARMNFAVFFFYTITSVAIWTVAVGLLGFYFGENWTFISKLISRFGLTLLAIAIIVAGYYYYARRKRGARNKA